MHWYIGAAVVVTSVNRNVCVRVRLMCCCYIIGWKNRVKKGKETRKTTSIQISYPWAARHACCWAHNRPAATLWTDPTILKARHGNLTFTVAELPYPGLHGSTATNTTLADFMYALHDQFKRAGLHTTQSPLDPNDLCHLPCNYRAHPPCTCHRTRFRVRHTTNVASKHTPR